MKNQKLEHGTVYRDTELLLENYRNLIWRLEENLEDVEATIYYMGGRHLSNLFRLLSMELDVYDNEHSRRTVEERLFGLRESKLIVDLIDKAMLKLKNYPKNGEKYFQILHTSYIDKEPIHQDEIQDKLLISNSSYYRYRKKAINILSGILWGFINSYTEEEAQTLPSIAEELSSNKLDVNLEVK
ncbi:MAG: DUF1492 domain-containing protein [Clostridiales bacterium]|nr:DUF1492 domain-containing protein [Clostridiales bacterium]